QGGRGEYFSQRRWGWGWTDKFWQKLGGFESRKQRVQMGRIRGKMFFLQAPPPRRDQSFHAQTRDLRPASFGFRIWPRKCNRHGTVEICARFRYSLQVERLCS